MSLLFQPMPLQKRPAPFDDPDWLFELKYDGFRALAEIEYGRCRLVSRNGNPFASFHDLALRIGALFPSHRVVLDGEIVCLDKRGRPQFKNLLFRRGEPLFVAFDLLYDTGKDLRRDQLLDRKAELRRLLRYAQECACNVRGSRRAAWRNVVSASLRTRFGGDGREAQGRPIR